MQVAIASTDGKNVNEHFGRAERFLIFEMNGEVPALIGIRSVVPLSEGDRNHEFNSSRFADTADQLSGCRRVYCVRIGEKPAEELTRLGIEPVLYEGLIESITRDFDS